MANANLSADVVRLFFRYDPLTGVLRRYDQENPTGRLTTNGYRQVWFDGRRYMAHRLVWLYVHGEWPKMQLDHINQNRDDNRIENLREVTNKQNGENVRIHSHNITGRRGVSWRKSSQSWQADIKHHGKTIYLGTFDNIVDAVAARMRAERELFTHAPVYSSDSPHGRESLINTKGFDAGLRHSGPA